MFNPRTLALVQIDVNSEQKNLPIQKTNGMR